ncbi:MAG: hypothetical protein LBC99_02615 [Spirochaetota bacterium]|jgi:hypothetical protein|nr:hypothetical protein [Spirochaetota bacterium]
MTSKSLNLKLVAAFPELEQAYREQTEWQEGDETGSHVVYEDVLVPVMRMLIKSGNYQNVQKYTDFLEELLALDDEYAANVIAVSVIENIFFDNIDKKAFKALLGQKCSAIWDGYEATEG